MGSGRHEQYLYEEGDEPSHQDTVNSAMETPRPVTVTDPAGMRRGMLSKKSTCWTWSSTKAPKKIQVFMILLRKPNPDSDLISLSLTQKNNYHWLSTNYTPGAILEALQSLFRKIPQQPSWHWCHFLLHWCGVSSSRWQSNSKMSSHGGCTWSPIQVWLTPKTCERGASTSLLKCPHSESSFLRKSCNGQLVEVCKTLEPKLINYPFFRLTWETF